MTPEEEAAVEAAARAVLRYEEATTEDGVAREAGPTPSEILEEEAESLAEWCALARVVSRRARQLRGEEVQEGASPSSRSTSGVEPLSPVSGFQASRHGAPGP